MIRRDIAAGPPDLLRRRNLLGGAAALGATLAGGAASWLAPFGTAVASDYRALVVVFLFGGNDGHNTLVPLDAGHDDYTRQRANLALSKASLAALPGRSGERLLGLHPSLAPLVPLYAAQRLAFIANVGPLVQPCTAQQVMDRAVPLPLGLMSHSEQVATVSGWTGEDESVGWAGRGLESLPRALMHERSAISTSVELRMLKGRSLIPTYLDNFGFAGFGLASNLLAEFSEEAQFMRRQGQGQFANAYENDYARKFGLAVESTAHLARVAERTRMPTQDFGRNELLARPLRDIARVMPVYRELAVPRQVFYVHWGSFDTHAGQRGSGPMTQDAQFIHLAQALAAFDEANRANGLDEQVVTLCLSEFGRTVRPSSGGGSEHAWGNHWWAFGGPVAGGQVQGAMPDLTPGGRDDSDPDKGGRHVPTISSDQVAATLMQWLGLDAGQFDHVFPWLVNFAQKTVPGLLRN